MLKLDIAEKILLLISEHSSLYQIMDNLYVIDVNADHAAPLLCVNVHFCTVCMELINNYNRKEIIIFFERKGIGIYIIWSDKASDTSRDYRIIRASQVIFYSYLYCTKNCTQ